MATKTEYRIKNPCLAGGGYAQYAGTAMDAARKLSTEERFAYVVALEDGKPSKVIYHFFDGKLLIEMPAATDAPAVKHMVNYWSLILNNHFVTLDPAMPSDLPNNFNGEVLRLLYTLIEVDKERIAQTERADVLEAQIKRMYEERGK